MAESALEGVGVDRLPWVLEVMHELFNIHLCIHGNRGRATGPGGKLANLGVEQFPGHRPVGVAADFFQMLIEQKVNAGQNIEA